MYLTDWIIAGAAVVNAFAVIVLVCVTRRYAKTTDDAVAEARRAALLGSYITLYNAARQGVSIPKYLVGDKAQDRMETLVAELEINLGSEPLKPSSPPASQVIWVASQLNSDASLANH